MTLDELIADDKCLVVHNHSGGKDSQASYLVIKDLVPADRLLVLHAHLPEVEWEGTIEHIKTTIDQKHTLIVCQSKKTFFEMVDHRKMFPSPKNRQCTSDLKRGPIEKEIKNHCNKHGFDKVLNIMGLRAQESSGRKKKLPFSRVSHNCNSKREWYEWLPIHELSTDQVFDTIKSADQKPHWVYSKGMTRKSCCFCIFSSDSDLKNAAKLKPDLAKAYCDREEKYNFSLIMPSKKSGVRFLKDIIA